MMNYPLWFSNRCPFFDVQTAERYRAAFPGQPISSLCLLMLDCYKSARWFDKYEEEWNKFLKYLPEELASLEAAGGSVLFWGDPSYPENLKNLYCPPSILFCLGDKSLLNQNSVSIVGARMPTFLGIQWVRKYVPDFTARDYVIVSGGARGIDSEAHEAALNSGGKTIAFLPGGVLNPYPSTHRYLFKKVVENGGLLVSEFTSLDIVRKENFHQRNRLIAAAGDAVIIVEAKLKSGTIMTANKARDEFKEVFVVPGHPLIENYGGSLVLLADGASIAISSAEPLGAIEKKCLNKIPLSLNLEPEV